MYRRGPLGRRPLAALAAALLAWACAGPGPSPPSPQGAAHRPGALHARTGLDLGPAFDQLGEAVRERRDPEARRILARIWSMGPTGPARRAAESYQRVLDGRALVEALDLRLESAPDPAAAGRFRVELVGTAGDRELQLAAGGGRLRFGLTALGVSGAEHRRSRTIVLDSLVALRFTPDRPTRLELGTFDLPLGGALAVRGVWELDLLAGGIREERDLPAMGVPVRSCEAVRLAPWLPGAPVEPGELIRLLREEIMDPAGAVASPQRQLPRILERTVRIAPARREEALDLLVPVALEMIPSERTLIVPSLRWLSGVARLGGDDHAWVGWLEERQRRLQEARGREPALELPAAFDRTRPPQSARR